MRTEVDGRFIRWWSQEMDAVHSVIAAPPLGPSYYLVQLLWSGLKRLSCMDSNASCSTIPRGRTKKDLDGLLEYNDGTTWNSPQRIGDRAKRSAVGEGGCCAGHSSHWNKTPGKQVSTPFGWKESSRKQT